MSTTEVVVQLRPRLIRAELRKIFTTRAWWIFGLFVLPFTGLAVLVNLFQANGQLAAAKQELLHPPDFSQMIPGERPTAAMQAQLLAEWSERTDVPRILASGAANVYTSGQVLNLMFIVILGALVVTNEYAHQTATATFLTTPHRTQVIVAKLFAAMALATGFWLVTTAMSVLIGGLSFNSNGYGFPFTDPVVLRSVAMNLLAYVVWAVLGVGLGVLLRSQLGATITGASLYWISWPVAVLLFGIIGQYVIKSEAIWNYAVLLPGVASFIMVSPEPLQFSSDIEGPQWWIGAVVLLSYAIVAGFIGTLLTRKRDVS